MLIVRSRLAPLFRDADVAWVYAAIVVVVAIVVEAAPGATTEELVLDSSTNLDNLRRHPLLVLGASAFVVAPLSGLWILAPLVVTFAAAQRWLGRAATVIVAALGHVGVTLFVAVLLAAGIDARPAEPGAGPGPGRRRQLRGGDRRRAARRPGAAPAAALVRRGPAGAHRRARCCSTPTSPTVGHLTAVLLGFALAVLVRRRPVRPDAARPVGQLG